MAQRVDKQRSSNRSKKIGGCTGKGFKKGKSGNEQGRPPTKTAEEYIRHILTQKPTKQLKKLLQSAGVCISDLDLDQNVAQLMFEIAVANAMAGDFRFFESIVNRLWGKVPERVAGADGGALPFTFHFGARAGDGSNDSS